VRGRDETRPGSSDAVSSPFRELGITSVHPITIGCGSTAAGITIWSNARAVNEEVFTKKVTDNCKEADAHEQT
jgi:hypothetical protein